MNSIYVRRRRKVYVKEGGDRLPLNYVATLQKNIEGLGFVLSEQLCVRLQTLSVEKLGSFYKGLVKDLRELIGAHREFQPFYPNFPDQVLELSEAQLYWNAILHYLTHRRPPTEKRARPALNERPALHVIDLGTKEEFEEICAQLAASRTSLSPQDKLDLAWFVAQYRDDVARLLPAEIPIKENLAFLGAQLLRHTSLAEQLLGERLKTATDVLRLAVALSDGDVSLAEPTKFTKFRRSERRQLLAWLERCSDATADMLRWKERWKRLGERLHPGNYADRFPKAFAAFTVLRSDSDYSTFHSKLEGYLIRHDAAAALELLSHRPGDLARRLDHLLRMAKYWRPVADAFARAAERVATPVLLQVLAHFRHRTQPRPLRAFFPKGEVAKVFARKNNLPPLPPEATLAATSICERTLIARFAKLSKLGRCYLDPRLTSYLVPFSQRSAAKALRTLVRGSRLPLPDARVLRFFLWWKNGNSRTDIDLSAALYAADFSYVDVVSYYNLKNFGGHHSGDIVDAPHGAAEFIDLDIERTRAGNVRYVVMSINSFTEQPYCDLPECFAGWMGRQRANSGEIFEPRTVQDKIDIAANTRICLPAVFDLALREVIWADLGLRKHPLWNNVRQNLCGMSLMLRALTGLVKPDLHTLFGLHIAARGEPASDPRSADCTFAVDQGVTPFDVSRIAAEFL
jgi:hypothetical protein